MPRVSLLLPCRDAAETLPDAIASIEAQTFVDFEVLALDDHSSDGTLGTLRAWAQRDARVRLLQARGEGLVAALSTLLSAALGELVARMDADDIAEPDRLARQVALLEASPGLVACGTRIRYFPREALGGGARRYERWVNAAVTPEEIGREIFVECPIPHPTLMVRRARLLGVGGYRDMGWPEDYDLVLRLWAAGYRLGRVPEVLLHWRESAGRHSRTHARYSEAAFRRCKVHWLARTLAAAHRDRLVVWGAGPVGKAFAREWLAQGHRLRGFIDPDPRKIGQTIHGAPVLAPAQGVALEGAFIVAAVGSAAARAEIRSALTAAGRRESLDFVAVA